jgi:hypothetical protein
MSRTKYAASYRLSRKQLVTTVCFAPKVGILTFETEVQGKEENGKKQNQNKGQDSLVRGTRCLASPLFSLRITYMKTRFALVV